MWLTMGGMLFAQLVHVTVGEGVFILLCLCLVLYKRGDDTIMAKRNNCFFCIIRIAMRIVRPS